MGVLGRLFGWESDLPIQIDGVQFEKFVANTKKHNEPDKMLKIWRSILGLNQWYVVSSDGSGTRKDCYAGQTEENKFWLYVYTSKLKAQRYIDKNDPNGSIYQILEKKPIGILDYIYKSCHNMVYGLCINESDRKIDAHVVVSKKNLEKMIRCINPSYIETLFSAEAMEEYKNKI